MAMLNLYNGYHCISPVNTKTPKCSNKSNMCKFDTGIFDDLIVSVEALHASQQNFSHFGTLPGLKQ